MTEKKMPGMVRDPWRSQKVAAPSPPKVTPPTPAELDLENDEDLDGEKFATIELVGYGGVTAEGTNSTKIAAARLLDFCVKERELLDPIFLDFGIILAQRKIQALPHIKFYIQRNDGWTLAIPGVRTRDEGAL